jgi:hypothetical protein
MIRRGDKRGSHVGVVISFAIFVTFIIFLYSIAQPSFQKEQKEESLMAYLEKTLIENCSDYLTIITVNVSTNPGKDCIQLESFTDTFEINNRIIVYNQEQKFTESAVSLSPHNDLRINRLSTSDSDRFFKIYHSESFDSVGHGSSWDCEEISEGTGYNLGVTKNEKYVFEEKFFDLYKDYTEGWYENLKDKLKIPRNFEFGFGLIYNNGSVVETENIDLSKDVYIKNVPIQYVTSTGKIESGFLKLKVW